MKLTLKNDKKYVAIEFPQNTSQDLTAILDRAFAYLASELEPVTLATTKVTIPIREPLKELSDEVFNPNIGKQDDAERQRARKIIEEAKARAASRPRVLPKVGTSEPTLLVNIGEQFGDKLLQAVKTSIVEETPEHWVTGIQYKDFDGEQVPCYRTYYYCPQGHKGKRYIPENTDFVHCHTCNSKIGVRLANEDGGFSERDEWGNFYIADQPWEEK